MTDQERAALMVWLKRRCEHMNSLMESAKSGRAFTFWSGKEAAYQNVLQRLAEYALAQESVK